MASVGLTLPKGGTVNNKATIAGTLYGINAAGNITVNNSGTISSSTGTAIENYLAADIISNTGIITGSTAINAIGTSSLKSSLINGGSIIATGGNAVTFGGAATVTNNSAKVIQATGNGLTIYGTGTVANAGTIIAGLSGYNAVIQVNGPTSSVSNTGTLKSGFYGVLLESSKDTVDNNGTIIVGSVAIQDAYGLTVVNNGLIQAGAGIQTSNNGGSSSLVNNGTIDATSSNGVSFGNPATVTNNAGKLIEAAGSGVQVSGTGKITNNGTIISTNAFYDYGAQAQGANSSIANNGLIQSGGYGVGLSASGGTITNSGTIKGTDERGIESFFGASITNNGLVTGSLGVDSGSQGGTTKLTNAGTIEGTNGNGVDVGSGGGSVTNNAKDLIQGSGNGVFMAGNNDTLSNSGTIIGQGVDADYDSGVQLYGNYANVNNTGTIQGETGISFYGTAGTLTTSGKIVGNFGTAVNLGTGNRLITKPGATFVGNIVGYGSSNILELTAGSPSNLSSAISNVGTLQIDAGASWALPGTDSVLNLTLKGTLSTTSGAHLSISVLDKTSVGALNLGANSTVNISQALGAPIKMTFTSGDTFTIDQSKAYDSVVNTLTGAGPLINNFTSSDKIDIADLSSSGLHTLYNKATGLLNIENSSGQISMSMAFNNQTLGSGTFHIGSDGAQGSLLTI